MKYQAIVFSVPVGESEDYRVGWERVFGKKPVDGSQEPTPANLENGTRDGRSSKGGPDAV